MKQQLQVEFDEKKELLAQLELTTGQPLREGSESRPSWECTIRLSLVQWSPYLVMACI